MHCQRIPRSLYRRYNNNQSQKKKPWGWDITVNALFSAEPARDSALRLGHVLLDGAVKIVHLLQSAGLCLLCVGLGLALSL